MKIRAAQTNTGEDDPEYADGLTELLKLASSTESVEWFTTIFDAGYLTGQTEGFAVRTLDIDRDSRAGCKIACAQMKASTGGVVDLPEERCNELVSADHKDAAYRGSTYARHRLQMAKTIPPEVLSITMTLSIFDSGYGRGFSSIDRKFPRTAQTLQSAQSGCLQAFSLAAKEYPDRSMWLGNIQSTCPELASHYANLLKQRLNQSAK